jgi:NAD+ synthase
MDTIDAGQTAIHLTAFLRQFFDKTGFSQAVIALSGGVDSATSAALTVRALGASNVTPLLLPYGDLSRQGTDDAMRVTESLAIPSAAVQRIDIQPLVDPILALDPTMDRVRRGNVMARLRMVLVFDAARKREALVVGTENKSEHLLGYFTRFGDEASDVEPLRGLYKTQVYQLARHLKIPEPVMTKKPSAGLWTDQTDEGEFGFSYAEADEILALLYDQGKSVEEAVGAGRPRERVEAVRAWVERNAFKHRLPVVAA